MGAGESAPAVGRAWPWPAADATAVLGTRHGKGQVIVPILTNELGLRVDVLDALDTDRFGTFTREIPRFGGFTETARAKARAALAAHGRATIGLASEGSFGPHPAAPFVAGGTELVLLIDRANNLELTGVDLTFETNFAATEVGSVAEALAFAGQALFPSHAMIVMPTHAGPAIKGITEVAVFERTVAETLRQHGRAWLETDMRAHLNPTRMRSIERATRGLVAAARSRCPECARPGFVRVALIRGLPCSDCGAPTQRARAEVLGCAGCGRRRERALSELKAAAPEECPLCNP